MYEVSIIILKQKRLLSHCLLRLVCEGSHLFLQNLWDLTPDTDLLKELPENYSFETALADLIVSVSVKLPEKIFFILMENLCVLCWFKVDIVRCCKPMHNTLSLLCKLAHSI